MAEIVTVTFLASFPAIQSAILIGDDGMRISLHIPEVEVPNAVGLIAMRDRRLRVTVEVVENDCKAVTNNGLEKRRDGKSKW
jgi:hypothetical protein